MSRAKWPLLALLALALLAYPSTRMVRSLGMTRGGMAAFTALVASANAGDLEAVRSLCSGRYLGSRRIERAEGGGVVGIPRNIHRNFQAWVEGDEVRICPTDRVGPVYRVVRDGGPWKFDGLVGRLAGRGRFEPLEDGGGVDPDFL